MPNGNRLGKHDCWITWEDEDALLNFSDELLEQLGWEVGDTLDWQEQEDGSFVLSKKDHG